ncbi:MAG: hypothetical protein PHH08_01510 [Candidatus ainarchaeum sp.]|nr:hypothetical protein [Candidatus ainarchaeum sp.]
MSKGAQRKKTGRNAGARWAGVRFCGLVGFTAIKHRGLLRNTLAPAMPKIMELLEQGKNKETGMLVQPVLVRFATIFALRAIPAKSIAGRKKALEIMQKIARKKPKKGNIQIYETDLDAFLDVIPDRNNVKKFIERFVINYYEIEKCAAEIVREYAAAREK